MAIHKISLFVETDDEAELDRLQEAIESAVCPHPATEEHVCPTRWFLMESVLDEAEARAIQDLLNE